jgi:hypothetical protein
MRRCRKDLTILKRKIVPFTEKVLPLQSLPVSPPL